MENFSFVYILENEYCWKNETRKSEKQYIRVQELHAKVGEIWFNVGKLSLWIIGKQSKLLEKFIIRWFSLHS